MLPLGLRNNNPGNIEDSPFSQSQPGYLGTDGRFAKFRSLDDGFNAMAGLYNSGGYKNLNTVSDIINRWAPPSDGNDVGAYSAYVSNRLGIGPNTPLNKSDPAQMRALAQAQAEYENGPNNMASARTTPMPAPALYPNQPQQDQGALAQPQAGPDWGGVLSGIGAGLVTAVNPGAGAQLQSAFDQQQLHNRPQLVDMGTDPFSGQKMWKLYDPRSRTFSDPVQGAQALASAQGGGPSSTSMASFNQNLADLRSGKITADEFRKNVPAMVQQEADAMLAGKASPNNLGMRNPQLRQAAILTAHALDENFDENQIPARQAAAKSLLSNNPSTLGGATASAQKIVQHLEHYLDNSEELAKLQPLGGAYNPVNYAQQALKSGGGDTQFKSILNAMNTDKDFVAGEITKLASGSHGALADREEIQKLLDATKSPQERRAAAREVVNIMQGGIDPLVSNYNKAFGLEGTEKERSTPSFFSDKTNKSLERILSTTAPQQQPNAGAAQSNPSKFQFFK